MVLKHTCRVFWRGILEKQLGFVRIKVLNTHPCLSSECARANCYSVKNDLFLCVGAGRTCLSIELSFLFVSHLSTHKRSVSFKREPKKKRNKINSSLQLRCQSKLILIREQSLFCGFHAEFHCDHMKNDSFRKKFTHNNDFIGAIYLWCPCLFQQKKKSIPIMLHILSWWYFSVQFYYIYDWPNRKKYWQTKTHFNCKQFAHKQRNKLNEIVLYWNRYAARKWFSA